jgi:ribose 5-phosphate isomerase B
MRIAIGCDHAGVELKRALMKSVLANHIVVDFGTDSSEPVDYPDIAKRVAQRVASGEFERGILICGTGIGMAMASGKTKGIRAATCTEPFSAEMSRRHNDANILCLGGRVTGIGMATKIAEIWLSTAFEAGRHVGRVRKID